MSGDESELFTACESVNLEIEDDRILQIWFTVLIHTNSRLGECPLLAYTNSVMLVSQAI